MCLVDHDQARRGGELGQHLVAEPRIVLLRYRWDCVGHASLSPGGSDNSAERDELGRRDGNRERKDGAATYDGSTGVFAPGAVNATADMLAELAGGGRALELGIGTGRIALPLASRGVPVRGSYDSYDVATQAMHGHYVDFANGRGEYRTIPFRYAWPAELDLMARLAGLRLRERWSGWAREPFTSDSSQHVSVWEKPAS
jgi:hypothetical protein